MTTKWCFLQDFIEDLAGEDSQGRFSVFFKRWITQYQVLKNLVEYVDTFGNTEILITDKYQFMDELQKLSAQKLIKSQLLK